MSKEAEKYKILSAISMGGEPKDIAEELGVSYAKVCRLRNEYKEAEVQGTIGKLMELTPDLVQELGMGIIQTAPQAEAAVTQLVDGVQGAQNLSVEFQNTASFLASRIKLEAGRIEHVSELVDLSKALCELQNAFFNKSVTQVNVQNNYDNEGGQAYGAFLGDAPGA